MATKRHEETQKEDQIGSQGFRSVFLSDFLFVSLRAALWPFLFILFTASLAAAEPNVRSVSLRGLQVGGTTTLTIDGDDLGTAPKLLLPFPAKQVIKGKSTDKQATFEVTLGSDVPPGYAHLRVATNGGVSLPVIVAVDALPQRPFASKAGESTAAFSGSVPSSSATVETIVKGKAGQKLQVEIESQRLGSKLRPVLHLYDPNRSQLAWAWPSPATFGDCRLEATLPADGDYTVTIHDVEYAAPAGSFFRLKLGEWDSVDFTFPPAISCGKSSVELLCPGKSLKVPLPNLTQEQLYIVPWPKSGTWSGARPWVSVSNRAEYAELGNKPGEPEKIPLEGAAVSGKLSTPFEVDLYRFPAKPGTKLKIEAFAERIGSPVDVALVIRNDAGAVLARSEDGTDTLDPAFEYTVPAKSDGVIVGVVDAAGRGGPRGVYRLSVEPVEKAADFALTTTVQRLTLSAGGRALLPVLVERRGYTGEIELAAEGLPAGVKLENNVIPAGADGTLVSILHSGSAGEAAITNWLGKSKDGVTRPVKFKDHPLDRLQPWLAGEITIAPVAPAKDAFAIDWNKFPEKATLDPGGKLSLPVKLTRPASASLVRLTLLTSQGPRAGANAQQQLLRSEPPAGVELAAKATEGVLPVTVPPQLAEPSYDVAVRAELLAADKRTVLATAFTSPKRLNVTVPKKK